MAKISPEEKRREASDWTKGLLGLAVVLGIILLGYVVFQGIKSNTLQQEAKKARKERLTQNTQQITDHKELLVNISSTL